MRVRILAAMVLCAGTSLVATDFLAEGVDNARTGWVKDEKIFTPANVGSMKLLWKVKLDSKPRAMHNLFAPLIAERVQTADGVKEIGVVAGISDDMFAIDVPPGTDLAPEVRRRAGPGRRRPTTRCARPGKPRCRRWRRPRRQVHGLRRVVGRPAAAVQCRGRTGCRARREVHARGRQALRTEPL